MDFSVAWLCKVYQKMMYNTTILSFPTLTLTLRYIFYLPLIQTCFIQRSAIPPHFFMQTHFPGAHSFSPLSHPKRILLHSPLKQHIWKKVFPVVPTVLFQVPFYILLMILTLPPCPGKHQHHSIATHCFDLPRRAGMAGINSVIRFCVLTFTDIHFKIKHFVANFY